MADYGQLTSMLVINTLEDELNADGDCSLREAITAANNNFAVDACGSGSAASDTITFSVSGVINLDEELTLTDGGPMVIDGGETITVSGQDSVRVFFINLGSQVTLRNLVVRNGAASDGAGIWNFGNLELENVQAMDNTADYDGGGILNYEALSISDSLIDGNHATWGGGISNLGTLTIAGSRVSNNSAGVTGGGGGISNVGTLQITNSSMLINSGGQGGAIHNGVFSLLSISFSSFISNTAFDGGGILRKGFAEITTSTFYGNSSQEYGGGIVNSGTFSLINSTLTGNGALEEGGGI